MPKPPYTRPQLEELILLQLQQMDVQRKMIRLVKEQNQLLLAYTKSLEKTIEVLSITSPGSPVTGS